MTFVFLDPPAEFAIAIPSIQRPKDVYVYKTVASLFAAMSEEESGSVIVIVCIAEVSVEKKNFKN